MKVGIIIPYNEDRGWLSEAVESIRAQAYDSDKIMRVSVKGDHTATVNFNKGLDVLDSYKPDLVRYLCEDDLLTPNSIADSVKFMTDNPDVDFMNSNAINFFPDGKEVKHTPDVRRPTVDQMLVANRIHGGTVVYRANCFYQGSLINYMNEDLWTGEEYHFNMSLLKSGFKIGYLNATTYKYRRHDRQKSLGNMGAAYQSRRRMQMGLIRQMIKDQ